MPPKLINLRPIVISLLTNSIPAPRAMAYNKNSLLAPDKRLIISEKIFIRTTGKMSSTKIVHDTAATAAFNYLEPIRDTPQLGERIRTFRFHTPIITPPGQG